MITHADYMADSANLHQQYHLEIAIEANVRLSDSMKERTRRSTDPNLNDIPLPAWDGAAEPHRMAIATALKARGTFWSLSQGVCVMKAYARHVTQTGG